MEKDTAIFTFLGPIPGTLENMALEDAAELGRECSGRGLVVMEEVAVGRVAAVGHGFKPGMLVLPATRALFPSNRAFYEAMLEYAAEVHVFLWSRSPAQVRLSRLLRELCQSRGVPVHLNCYSRRVDRNVVTRL